MDGLLVLGAVFAAMALAVLAIVQLRRRYGANGDYSGDGGHSHHGNDDGGCDGGDGGGD